MPESPDSTESRLQRIEERIAWLEHLTAELDSVLRPLADQLAQLRNDLTLLQDQQKPSETTDGGYEIPPHY